MKPTQKRVRDLLDYDPETGLLTRRYGRGSRPAGSVAGNVCRDGRVQISIDGYNFKAHQIIWLHATGYWPTHDIDHIDGNPTNNRWKNLRDVPHNINLQNRQKAPAHNANELLGVTKNRDRFGAQIKIDGKRKWLGTYDTPEEAHAVYLEAKRRLHDGCTL